MKIIFFLFVTQCIIIHIFSQNVGIGITDPVKSKFEVYGAGAGGFTSGLFGSDGAGISLQRNWPTIGFNQYNNGVSRYMSNGFAVTHSLNMGNGSVNFTMYPSGLINTTMPAGKIALSLFNNGNVGIQGSTYDASLSVLRGTGFAGTALFAGTTHLSHFNYSIAEDTYIRGGKDGATLYLNDIPNGNVQIGDGSTRVGINTAPNSTPAISLDVNGAVAYRPLVAAIARNYSNAITIGDRSYLYITNADHQAPSWNHIFTISNGVTGGQILIIESDEANAFGYNVRLFEGPNVDLESSSINLDGGATLTLIWNGSRWHEISHSFNY